MINGGVTAKFAKRPSASEVTYASMCVCAKQPVEWNTLRKVTCTHTHNPTPTRIKKLMCAERGAIIVPFGAT